MTHCLFSHAHLQKSILFAVVFIIFGCTSVRAESKPIVLPGPSVSPGPIILPPPKKSKNTSTKPQNKKPILPGPSKSSSPVPSATPSNDQTSSPSPSPVISLHVPSTSPSSSTSPERSPSNPPIILPEPAKSSSPRPSSPLVEGPTPLPSASISISVVSKAPSTDNSFAPSPSEPSASILPSLPPTTSIPLSTPMSTVPSTSASSVPSPVPSSKVQKVDISLDMGGKTVPAGTVKGVGQLPVLVFKKAPGVPKNALTTYAEGAQFELSFTLPIGSYDIDLAFVEKDPANCQIGRRVFNVFVDGNARLEAFDIFQQAGNACSAAIVKTFKEQVEAVRTKPITIRFDSVAGKASVSYVRVRTSSNQCIPEIGNINLKNGLNHVAHAVPGRYPWNADFFVDNAGLGFKNVYLDGRRSHSHLFDAVSGQTATIKSYLWTDAESNVVLSTKSTFKLRAKLGTTRVRLRVVDTGCSEDEAETTITVSGKTQKGAYCYYYSPQNELLTAQTLTGGVVSPKFSEAVPSLDLSFKNFEGKESLFSVRCVFSLSTKQNDETQLILDTIDSGEATLYKGADLVIDSRTSSEGSTVTTEGLTSFEVIYRRTNASKPPRLRLSVAGTVPQGDSLSHDQSLVLPIISGLTPPSMRETGGARVRINGYGLFQPLTVRFGGENAKVNVRDSSSTRLFVNAPPGNGVVQVVVESSGELKSNALSFKYGSGCTDPIQFEKRELKNANGHIDQPTAAELWRDGKLYLGTRHGSVSVIEYDTDSLSVTNSCSSEKLIDPKYQKNGKPAGRHILGLTFDPRDNVGKPYVTVSTLFWTTKSSIDYSNPEKWSNGGVVRLKPADANIRQANPKRCLMKDRTIVRNLPVSGSDHGVNDLLFNQDGDLLIAVGGLTNAGLPYYRMSGTWEAKLSGAIVIAHMSRPNFNGYIDYDVKDNLRIATPKNDHVEPYAVGFRNSFRLAMRRNGDIFALDNGPNCGYGNVSYSCDEYDEAAAAERDIRSRTDSFPSQVDTTNGGKCKNGVWGPDKLVRLVKGGFYGHPNLQRGGDECSWINGYTHKTPKPKRTNAPKRYQRPIAVFGPATTGLIEYGAQHFCGALRGELIVSRFKGFKTERVKVGENPSNGKARKSERLFSFGGLRNVENEHGDIIFPKLSTATLVARPKVSSGVSSGLFIANAIPYRSGVQGGGLIRIGGRGFKSGGNIQVSVGGNECKVTSESNKLVTCILPKGERGSQADLVVKVGLDEAILPKAILYMNV